jgi:hypothetical protein
MYISVHKAAERFVPLDSFVITLLYEESEIDPVYLIDLGKRYFGRTCSLWPKGYEQPGDFRSGKPILISNSEQASDINTVLAGNTDDDEETESIAAVPDDLGW